MIKDLPPLFREGEMPRLIEFEGEISGASIAFFNFVDLHSSTSFQKEKWQALLKPDSPPFPDKIDSTIWDDYYLGKLLLFRGELLSHDFEYRSQTGHTLKGKVRFFVSVYDSMVACLQMVLPLHASGLKANKPIDFDVLLDLLNINYVPEPVLFLLDGQKTNFFDACQTIGNQLADALQANPNEVKHYQSDYNTLWLFDADRACESGDDFVRKYPLACAGVLELDRDWRKLNTSEVLEAVNNDVGSANTYITLSERVMLAVASRWDMESSWEKFNAYGCDPALLRAQEYAYYHRLLLEKAHSRIPKVEQLMHLIRSSEVDAEKLRHILELRLRMVRDLTERWNPYVFERGQETRIIELYFEMHGLQEEYKLAIDRLNTIGDILLEYYQLGQNDHLRRNQEQLIKIQKTNLISQLQIEEIARFSQQNRNAISLIGFMVILSVLLEVAVNSLRFLKEGEASRMFEWIRIFSNNFINFSALCLIGIVGAYILYVVVGKIRQLKQYLQYKAMRNAIEKKAEFYSMDDEVRQMIKEGKTGEAAVYLGQMKEEIKKYEQLLKQTKSLKQKHGIPI